MFTLEDYLTSFAGSLIPHAVLAVYLFVIMGTQGLKKLPALLLSPLLAVLLAAGLYALLPNHGVIRYCMTTLAILLMCTFWVRWAWRTGLWRAFSAVCMGGVFQMATSCLTQILILYSDLPLAAVMAVSLIMVPAPAFLLCRLRFGHWFRLLLEEGFGQRRTALFLFAMGAAMEAFLILQVGVQPDYLIPYGEQKIDCRLEVLYPVERVGIDVWDFTRCLGILLDNAAEAALETETPWVEIILLAQRDRLSLRMSNPYIGAIDPDKIWTEGFSTKGEGRPPRRWPYKKAGLHKRGRLSYKRRDASRSGDRTAVLSDQSRDNVCLSAERVQVQLAF